MSNQATLWPAASSKFLLVTYLLFASLAAGVSNAAAVKTDHTEVELIAEVDRVIPGTPFWIAYRLQADPGWHTYWRNPGDSGLPSQIDWQLPAGWQVSDLHWPYPELISTPPFATHAYHDEVLLLAQVTPPDDLVTGDVTLASEVTLAGEAAWLVCKELCLRETASLSVTLPVGDSGDSVTAINRDRFDQARSRWPQQTAEWQFSATAHEEEISLTLTGPAPPISLAQPVHFFPYQGEQIEPAAPQLLFKQQQGYQLRLQSSQFLQQPLTSLQGTLVNPAGWDRAGQVKALHLDLPVQQLATAIPVSGTPVTAAAELMTPTADSSAAKPTFWLALLMAFVGGMILNLMPCVFPVLSIKVLAFVDMAQGDKGHVRRHGLLFALGILLSFWLLTAVMLGLQQAGSEIGWGFQLQSPTFVALLSLLLFLLSLNLLGVFEVGGTVMRLAGNADTGSGYWSSFSTGVLATAVATPCTAPFMGAALGYALLQPPHVTISIFTAVALGLAAPYLLLSEAPGLLKKLPRPGPWMITFRQLLAFPLLASAIWLGWVLGHQKGVDGVALLLLAMLLLALAGWLHGLQQHRTERRRWLDGLLILILLLLVPFWNQLQSLPDDQFTAAQNANWQPFDQQRIDTLVASREPLFIDFTAAWCITCQVNKRVALARPEVEAFFRQHGIKTFRADWTNQNAAITTALEKLGRSGVPAYVYYDPTGKPHLLPELLTPELVINSLTEAGLQPAQTP